MTSAKANGTPHSSKESSDSRAVVSVTRRIGRTYWQVMRGMINSSRNPAPLVMLSPETILQGRYRIIRQLGQGGMGAVYEALDERLDTTVALKETLFTDEQLRKQVERQARLLARLHHQALPRVSDHFNEGDGQFLVMQYVAGD